MRGPLDIDSWCAQRCQGGHFARPEVTQIRSEHRLRGRVSGPVTVRYVTGRG